MPHADLDLARYIRPGDTVLWGQAGAEPQSLVAALVAQRQAFARIRVFLGIGQSGLIQPEHVDAMDFVAYCGSGTNRSLTDAGVLDIVPCHYLELPQLVRDGALRVDVLMLQVSPADASGRHSFGLAMEYLPAALASARVVIGEINDQVPLTNGACSLAREDFDLLVHASYAVGRSAPALGARERAIGAFAASLIGDGATLQIGLGAVPDAVLGALMDRRDLGLHSGAATDGVAALAQSGALTNARKSIDTGVGVAGLLIGSEQLHRYVDRNPSLRLCKTEYTHDPAVLSAIKNLVAINSAIEVDLTGQINAEVASGSYVGAVGGAGAFLQAARRSHGGLPIVALPACAGPHSRIVARLSGPVSTARCDAGFVITEHGIADLRGRSLAERVRRMLDIAAPEHRERLAREAHETLRYMGPDGQGLLLRQPK
ncbi:acetyl-CoA hydrolase [Acidovorax sp. D2M1]|uniref:Acetyl-CoA hydrolase n=1 Tax=Acidovorax benzenivorans TaxID=2987520 RepID=A0ABT5RZY7_9BURK|nr:acetyl-CoA hydrolase [Acidovorax benzenivorans]